MYKKYEQINIILKKCKLPIIYKKIYSSYEDVLQDMFKILENLDKIYSEDLLLLKDNINIIDKQKILFTILYNLYLNLDVYIKINYFNIYNMRILEIYNIKGLSRGDKELLEDNNQKILYNINKIEKLSLVFDNNFKYIDNKIARYFKKDELLDILKYIEDYNNDNISIEKKVVDELEKVKSEILKDTLFNFDYSKRYLKENFNKYLEKEIKIYINMIEKVKIKEKKDKKEKNSKNTKKLNFVDNSIILMQYKKEKSKLTSKLNKEIHEYREKEVSKNTEIRDKEDLKKYYKNFLEIKKINMLFDKYFKEYLILIVKIYYQNSKESKLYTIEEYLEKNNLIDVYSKIYKSFKEDQKLQHFLKTKKTEIIKKVYNIYYPFLKNIVTFEIFDKIYTPFDIYKEYGRCINIELSKYKKENNNVCVLNKDKIYNIRLLDKKYSKKILKQLEIFGNEYLKTAKEYIGENNIYYSEEANFRSIFIPSYNMIFLSGMDTKTLLHELGHAIHNRLMIKNNIYIEQNNRMLVELYSQMLEYVEIMNIISNKEINIDSENYLKIYSIIHRFLNIEEKFKKIEIQNKMIEYLKEIFKNYNISTLSKEEQDEQIEKNIDKLINNLTEVEQRSIFFTGEYTMDLYEEIEYFFPLYLIPTIYNNIKNEDKQKGDYTNKYIQSMKNFKKITLEQILNMLEVNPKNASNKLIKNYISTINEISKFLDEVL